MGFLEIFYQAEISIYEDPDFAEIARINCNEDPDTRQKAIQELRSMIYERRKCTPHRMDDAYLLRFLRCRRFIPASAHNLIVRYETFRKTSAYLFDCDMFSLTKVKHVYSGVYPDSPDHGRILIIRMGRWQDDQVSINDAIRTALVLCELSIRQPKIQILGVTIIVDLVELRLSLLRHLTPRAAHDITSLMGINIPLMVRSIHVINYNWIMTPFCYILKQASPKSVWNLVHYHGYDMDSLHRHIDTQHLPAVYGGTGTEITCEEFLPKINKYKDDTLVREFRNLGFTIKD